MMSVQIRNGDETVISGKVFVRKHVDIAKNRVKVKVPGEMSRNGFGLGDNHFVMQAQCSPHRTHQLASVKERESNKTNKVSREKEKGKSLLRS